VLLESIHALQVPLKAPNSAAIIDHPSYPPRIDYAALYPDEAFNGQPPDEMKLHALHVSGESRERVDLTFFSDGCG
jgi:hypothetical protein